MHNIIHSLPITHGDDEPMEIFVFKRPNRRVEIQSLHEKVPPHQLTIEAVDFVQ